MAAVLLQSNGAFSGSATSINIAFANAVQPHSLLIAYGASPTTARTMSASDNVNGAYNIDKAAASSCSIMSFPNTGGGTPTVTITISGAATIIVGVIEEWANVNISSPLDKTINNSGASTNTGTGGTTATLSQTNELVVAMLACNSNAGANFLAQSPFTPSPSSPQGSGANIYLATGYNVLGNTTAAQTCTFNWTNNVNFRSCTATYTTVQLGQIAPYYNRKNVLYFI